MKTLTREQKIRELASQLTEVADYGSMTREDALRVFSTEYNALTRYDREASE